MQTTPKVSEQKESPRFLNKSVLQEIKAIYATASTVSFPERIDELIHLIETTELNAIVVNIKDGDGVYLTQGMANLAHRLKEKNIYSIARIVVFQDNSLARQRPDLALKTKDGQLWSGKGYYWVDPASQEAWQYNTEVAIRALDLGFQEINFDYIRFPSDGDISEIIYPIYDGITLKEKIINDSLKYLTFRIKIAHPQAVLSIDLFAYSFLVDNDLNVGQRLIKVTPYFDIIVPMIYPSHYTPGNFGFENPALEPYQVVFKTLTCGKEILKQAGQNNVVIRPWIQAFNIGAIYTPQMIREEIRAISDVGLKYGWMVWNPANIYDSEAFLKE